MLQLKIMLVTLRKNAFRSFLALFALALGIASVVAMLALNAGAQSRLNALADQTGKNLVTIKTKSLQAQPSRGGNWYDSPRLQHSDIAAVKVEVAGVADAVPIVQNTVNVQFERFDVNTTVIGTLPAYSTLRNHPVSHGRPLDDLDVQHARRVALVGAFVAKKIAEDWGSNLLGQSIWIGGVPFEVVGLLDLKGVTGDGVNEDDKILIPVSTAERRLFDLDYLHQILIQLDDGVSMRHSMREINRVLLAEHRIGEFEDPDFDILQQVQPGLIRQMNQRLVGGLSTFFAIITLGLAAAGVLSVTYLNVTDRTAEIGLRMAVGASRWQIGKQFLLESMFVSFSGGVIGIAMALLTIGMLREFTQWELGINYQVIAFPLLLALFFGSVLGAIPASRAARMMPVNALQVR